MGGPEQGQRLLAQNCLSSPALHAEGPAPTRLSLALPLAAASLLLLLFEAVRASSGGSSAPWGHRAGGCCCQSTRLSPWLNQFAGPVFSSPVLQLGESATLPLFHSIQQKPCGGARPPLFLSNSSSGIFILPLHCWLARCWDGHFYVFLGLEPLAQWLPPECSGKEEAPPRPRCCFCPRESPYSRD